MQPPPSSVSLSIGPYRFHVQCNFSKLGQALEKRYHEFQPSPSGSLFTLDILLVGREYKSALINPALTFQEKAVSLDGPGYCGAIDLKNRAGFLRLSSTRPVEDIDYFLRIVLALLAFEDGGILLHSAGLVRDKKCFLFFGHSGAGKTTVCRTSQDKAVVLNDDLILILPLQGTWQAYGTPFWNPTQVKPKPQNAPISEIYYLVQAKEVSRQKISSAQALAALIANVPVISQDPKRSRMIIERLVKILGAIPVFTLNFLPDDSFWQALPV